jgi:hypothetical protein
MMKNVYLFIALFCLTISVAVQAQVKPQPKPKTPPKPETTQSAKTDDGRVVILRSNGTWEYDKNAKPTPTPNNVMVEETGTLSFDTGLVMKSGDVKPVARATFYLLNQDLVIILAVAGLQELPSSWLTTFARKYASRESDQFRGAEVYTYFKAMAAVKPHIVATATTDFGGKGQFTAVKPGTYYLMNVTEIGSNVVLWNLEVKVKAGQNSVTLDQNNAAETF